MIDVLATVKNLKRFRCGGEYRPRTIDSIPDSISKLTQLERIAINGTFASVPVTWSKLSKLDVLQLYSPNLRALPADMLDMNITMLSLEEDKTGVPNSDWIAGLITGEAWGSVKLDALGTDLSIPEKTVLFHILQQTHQGLASLKKGDWLVHLNHSLPLVRKATLRCLEELAEVPSIASGASFCLLGKIKMGKGKAKTGVQELSASISKDITKDTIVVLGDKPGDLDTVLEAGAAIISEAHLSDMFDNKGQNFLRPGEDKTKGSNDENETKLRGLLESPNAKNASVAAQIMKAGGMPDGLLYHTFVASFDTELDAKGRDALRKIWKQFGPGTFVDAIKQTRFRASNDLAESTLFKNLGKLASSPGGIDTLAIANVFFTRHGQAVKYILEEGDSDSKKRVLAKLVNGSVLNLNGVDGLRDPDISKGEEESEFGLSSVPAEVGELTKLRTLSLRAIRLKGGLPEWMPNLSGLEELDLAYTSLRKLPGIENLSKLKILDLHNNLFTALPKELLELSKLEELLLAYNHNLKKVPELSALTSLRVLDLSWCGKTGVPKSLVGLEKLEELRLTRAERWKLPELGNMPKLREFEIGNSDCSVFPEQLLGCPDLEVISFNDTDIKDIPTEISKLKDLKRLILGGDTKVPKAIKKALQKKMPNLQIW
ncbi:MAG: leucine-rich repeat domain-containing protein [Kofleriaceae bacterium]|nr:leucine-rich repeat domain-containing protein [Kofleriaceae bacterium]